MKSTKQITELDGFRNGDGAHCGLTDWYPPKERALRDAIMVDEPFTTGWYSSKKEIASAKITHTGKGKYIIEVSVSDDFDTEGNGQIEIDCSQKTIDETISEIQDAIHKAWADADENQKGNRVYTGFSIHNEKGSWVETYIRNDSDFLDEPPGDYYHKWGFQGDCKLPKSIKEKLTDWAESWGNVHHDKELKVGKWTIKPWEQENE